MKMKSRVLLFGVLWQIFLQYANCQLNGNNNNNYLQGNHLYDNAANASINDPLLGLWRQGRSNPLSGSCTTDDGSAGTCMTRFNCMRQNGVVKGYCGVYGVCCETSLLCGGISRLKRVVMKNPTQFVSTQCQFTIEPYSANVCQLLVEFQKFDLSQPQLNANGQLECMDYLSVGRYTDLCGDISGQHLYLQFFGSAAGTAATFQFNLPSMSTANTWTIIVTQLECPVEKKRIANGMMASMMPWNTGPKNLQEFRTIFSAHNSDLDLLAPSGCDQFYRDTTGTIQSFNYRNGVGYYLPNMKYTICIKHIPGANMIEYRVNTFSLSAEIAGQYYDEMCHPTITTDGHRNDYLMIPQVMFLDSTFLEPTYFCGKGLVAGQSLLGEAPFIMYFSSDRLWDTDEIGFSITYNVKTIF